MQLELVNEYVEMVDTKTIPDYEADEFNDEKYI